MARAWLNDHRERLPGIPTHRVSGAKWSLPQLADRLGERNDLPGAQDLEFEEFIFAESRSPPASTLALKFSAPTGMPWMPRMTSPPTMSFRPSISARIDPG